jgi:hypothetical protein
MPYNTQYELNTSIVDRLRTMPSDDFLTCPSEDRTQTVTEWIDELKSDPVATRKGSYHYRGQIGIICRDGDQAPAWLEEMP